MHIGFLTPEYPHSRFGPSGGLGTSIRNLAASLVRKGEKVTVFVYGQKKDEAFQEEGIHFLGISQIKYPVFGWYLYRKYLEKILNKTCLREGIDLIEAPDWTGISAFMKLKVPLVIRCNGSDAYFCELEGRKQKAKNRFFERKALSAADRVLAVSAFTARETKRILGLNKEIEVIPNSLEVDDFLPSNIEAKKDRILYFGTLIRKKGVLELAETFNILIERKPEAELILIGKDVTDIFENRSTLELFKEKLSSKALKSLKYHNEVSYEEVTDHIARASVVVLPSFAEALPMTWLEAMAMEKALVTSNIGWAKEVMVDGETGFTVDPKSHEAYADKILYLLDNPEIALKMGQAARKQVEKKFATRVVVEQNIAFYQQVLREYSN